MSPANYLPRTDYLALKAASRELVRACGTQEQAARISRVGQQHISKCVSAAEEHAETFLPLDAVADLEAECGQPIVTRELARLSGCQVAECDDGPVAPCLRSEFVAMAREQGEALTHGAAIAAEDDPGEALLMQALKEFREARRSLRRMEAGVQARIDALRARTVRP